MFKEFSVKETGFADFGNRVICVDVDKAKMDMLNNGQIPIYEPGLKELVDKNFRGGRLSLATDITDLTYVHWQCYNDTHKREASYLNSYVGFDVPDNSIVIGNPGKIVSDKGNVGYINRTVEVLE